MSELKSKIERFALALSKRKDKTLNDFFTELVGVISKTLKELSPDSNLVLKAEVLETENRKLKRFLKLFTDVEYYEVSEQEYDFLDTMRMRGVNPKIRKPDFYSHDALVKDLSDYRDIIAVNKEAKFSLYRENLSKQLNEVLIGYQQKLSQEIRKNDRD